MTSKIQPRGAFRACFSLVGPPFRRVSSDRVLKRCDFRAEAKVYFYPTLSSCSQFGSAAMERERSKDTAELAEEEAEKQALAELAPPKKSWFGVRDLDTRTA